MPSVTSGILEAANGTITLLPPRDENLPLLGPKTITPANAAAPPQACTKVEPAKSEKPAADHHPPPHCHPIDIGYIIPAITAANMKNGQILILSATAPETIEAVAQTNMV